MKQNRVESRNYLDMTAEKPGDTEREELCFRYLLDQIPDQRIPKLLELFGGIGLFRSLVASPEYHESWDFSEDCCHHIQNKFPRTLVRRVDSFSEEIEKGFDLISADFNAWTPLKQLSDPKYKVLDRIFQALPRYVQFTDAAISKLHLNYKSYAVVIGNWVRPPPPRRVLRSYFCLGAGEIRL